MKIEKVNYPIKFEVESLFQHPAVRVDLKNLFKKTTWEQRVGTDLDLKIKLLIKTRFKVPNKTTHFEQLSGNEFCAFRFIKKKYGNLRIVFKVDVYKEQKIIVLLHAFFEDEDKSKGKHSYKKAIEISKLRFEQLEY